MYLRPNRKCGLTIIEILVTIAVLSILAAVTLIAIQGAREASRKAQCMNNLKNLGISIEAHVEAKGTFPRSVNAHSPLTSLLPYLEQGVVFNSINMDITGYGPIGFTINKTAFSVKIDSFICPSDTIERVGYGPCNYAGNIGYGIGLAGANDNGPFVSTLIDKIVSRANVRDGMSQTASMSEFCRSSAPERDSTSGQRHPKRSVIDVGEHFGADRYQEFLELCQGADIRSARLKRMIKGWCWAFERPGMTLYNHNIGPNGHTCDNSPSRTGAWTASSVHDNGVYVLFLDGHVKFMKEKIQLEIWHSIGSMNGSEIINQNPN